VVPSKEATSLRRTQGGLKRAEKSNLKKRVKKPPKRGVCCRGGLAHSGLEGNERETFDLGGKTNLDLKDAKRRSAESAHGGGRTADRL
jgi:hypothetical protein